MAKYVYCPLQQDVRRESLHRMGDSRMFAGMREDGTGNSRRLVQGGIAAAGKSV